jgi:membrane dipeptidase
MEQHAEIVPSKELAERLGVSQEAVELVRSSETIDLHLEPYLTHRLFGYDLLRRHAPPPGLLARFGHLDVPRLRDAGLAGGMWSITTNPFRTAAGRWKAFEENLERLTGLLASTDGVVERVRTLAEYRAARGRGAHAAFLSVQGGNAFAAAPDGMASVRDQAIVRVTLVHLTNSCFGATSSPLSGWGSGLTSQGRSHVEDLNANRVFVDLAHIDRQGFWDALEVHDPSQPVLVTHTGVDGILPHWRNLDDAQIKAVAQTGGTVGIIFARQFLRRRGAPDTSEMVVEHLAHIVDVAGDEFASLGSDYDGAILPPPDLRSGDAYARIVQGMLDRGWSEERIGRILGGNYLRALEMLRPG